MIQELIFGCIELKASISETEVNKKNFLHIIPQILSII